MTPEQEPEVPLVEFPQKKLLPTSSGKKHDEPDVKPGLDKYQLLQSFKGTFYVHEVQQEVWVKLLTAVNSEKIFLIASKRKSLSGEPQDSIAAESLAGYVVTERGGEGEDVDGEEEGEGGVGQETESPFYARGERTGEEGTGDEGVSEGIVLALPEEVQGEGGGGQEVGEETRRQKEREGESEGGEGGGEESMHNSEKGAFLTLSLLHCLKVGTGKDSVGSLTYDGVMRCSTEKEMLKAKGRALMTRAFQDAVYLVASSVVDINLMMRLMEFISLRHHHYGVTADKFPQVKTALLGALEMLTGDGWDVQQEKIWTQKYEELGTVLVRGINSMGRRLELIKSNWKLMVGTLGKEALTAKISANLVSLNSAQTNGGDGSPGGKQASAGGGGATSLGHVAQREAMLLSKDIGKMLAFLVQTIDDLGRLRGLIEDIGVPWDEIFSHYGAVPNMQRVQGVVLKTMEEVVGGGWGAEHEESWNWLLELAAQERRRRWRSIDRDRVLQGYQAVEATVLGHLHRDSQNKAQGRDFYAEEDSSVKDRQVSRFPKEDAQKRRVSEGAADRYKEGDTESQDIEGCEEAGGKATQDHSTSRRGSQKARGGLWGAHLRCCGRGNSNPSSSESGAHSQKSKGSSSAKQKRMQKVEERLDQGCPVKEEVAKAISKEFFRLLPLRAPNLGVIFEKQPERYEQFWVQLITRLLAYINEPEGIWADDSDLAVRHIEYGVLPADIPIFGGLFLKVMEIIAQSAWSKQYSDSWQKYCNIAASGLSEIVCAGAIPVTRAVVYASLPELKEALAEAPRGKRVEWGCKLVIKREETSPFFWMLERGRIPLARHILRDILAIRQNKSYLMFLKGRLRGYFGLPPFYLCHTKRLQVTRLRAF
uniref:Globin family profile domain-containing protein n=1 Tax=Chromera velia CCMP2878 TaxID=1169474 RepID=A0A0G4HHX0_9ALVE|eukprot:Cvel_6874.t1-p1 / transcript=Cvel_6874.t1 / gene=Cvel_6874 / organism=Chromera_velia_CCMP2878 / gene_product=hypothetical protein / transcript_product=hypothetical protein / location=Cvel_scaffold347:66471-75919(-) / protein_length=876 / sequence_SO=supercontig / SO=protein_coding / is_pseudo=false